MVPILRNADQLSIADIEKAIADFGRRAADGKLGIEEMTGGVLDLQRRRVRLDAVHPIINPQSAILGVHATKAPVVENGQIVIRPMNYLALSYDHRIIDGREAVLGLVAMRTRWKIRSACCWACNSSFPVPARGGRHARAAGVMPA